MDKKRIVENFIEMVKIYSPSKGEGRYVEYLGKLFKELGLEVYLDEGHKAYGGDGATIFAKLPGTVLGKGITLAAHTDVVGPCENINPIIDGDIIRTDGTTTLGADDKAGIAVIIETIKVLKEKNIPHEDIYILLTPCEEIGMLGAKNIDWEKVPSHMVPAKDVVVIDNAGRAGFVAHTAPGRYDFTITFHGRKAHAGIEPEKGINAIQLASKAIAAMNIGRIDEGTTSNLGTIQAKFPSNVVANECVTTGEVRSHSVEKILSVLDNYRSACDRAVEEMGGSYTFEDICAFPPLKPVDDLKFAKEFAAAYESMGIESVLQIIGGGSDSNIFAERGYNSVIIGVGMYDVHTVQESLDTAEMFKTTETLIKFISKEF